MKKRNYDRMQKKAMETVNNIPNGSVVSVESLLRFIALELAAAIDAMVCIGHVDYMFEEDEQEEEEKENDGQNK